MPEDSGELYVEILHGRLDIDWSADGEALTRYMQRALAEMVNLEWHMYHRAEPTIQVPVRHHRFGVESEELKSTLLLVPTGTGFRAFVAIEDASHSSTMVQPWVDAVLKAISNLEGEPVECKWGAVISPVGQPVGRTQFVTTEANVGDLEVSKSTIVYLDIAQSDRNRPTLTSYSVEPQYPITVRGSTTGHDIAAVLSEAATKVNRLCALLSVVWDADWQIRSVPEPLDERTPPLPAARMSILLEAAIPVNRIDVAIPQWCSTAWGKMDDDESLSTALFAHHQGVILENSFPSYAMIAYVGVIEGLGAKIEDLRRCDCCANCTTKIGAGKRFQKSLALVLDKSDVRRLSDVYNLRSKTAHEGRLHGHETSYGSFHLNIFMPESSQDKFRYDVMRDMRNASRRLLVHYLSN